MPIPFEKLKYNDILCHKDAYDYFDKAGCGLFEDWDMIAFEKAVLGAGDTKCLQMAEKVKEMPNLYHDLDEKMPFLRFREDGQHYGYELFLSPPAFWGSRGAPFWWAYAARKFTHDKLPMDEAYLYEKYKSIANEFGLKVRGNDYVYVKRFDAGGLSSGRVGEEFICHGWYTIRDRNRMYVMPKPKAEKLYMDRAKERILWYCKLFRDNAWDIHPEFDSEILEFALEDCPATEHQKEIATTLWGLYTEKPMKNKEAAEYFNVSVSAIRQAETRAIHYLLYNKNLPIIQRKQK